MGVNSSNPVAVLSKTKNSFNAILPSSQPAFAVLMDFTSTSTGKSRRYPAVAFEIVAAAFSKRNCASLISSDTSGGKLRSKILMGLT